MLIEFRVANYRSIKEEVVLSAVAQNSSAASSDTFSDRYKQDRDIAEPFSVGNRGLELLPVLGIFGPNASGKTSVLQALDVMLSLMQYGAPSEILDAHLVWPFLFSEDSRNEPTRFHLSAACDGIIYDYHLLVSRKRVFEERLEYTPPTPNRRRLLYSRIWSTKKERYDWHNGETFPRPLRRLQEHTKAHHTFASLLVEAVKAKPVMPLAAWLGECLSGMVHRGEQIADTFTTGLIRDQPDWRNRCNVLLGVCDTGISALQVPDTGSPEMEDEKTGLWVSHDTERGKVWTSISLESPGTKRLIALTAPVLLTLEGGGLLVLDEFGANWHSGLSRLVVKLFQSEKSNPKRAQLIFASHDTTLMHDNGLRRDQIWFTAKRSDHSTALYPLSDFHVRKDLALAKAYIDGRFGAVPILPGEDELATMLAEEK